MGVRSTLPEPGTRYPVPLPLGCADVVDFGDAGRPTPIITEAMVLDLLTPVQLTPSAGLLSVGSLFVGGFDHTSVVMVTGPAGPSSQFASSERMSAVRIGEGAQAAPGVALAASDALEFIRLWQSWGSAD